MTLDKDVRETPPELFAQLEARFHFDLDAAASHENAKCDLYMTEDGAWGKALTQWSALRPVKFSAACGLTGSWKGRRVWCNPPFSDIRPWVAKAWESEADLVVMLVPANRTEQPFWQELVEPHRDQDWGSSPPHGWDSFDAEFLPGRIRFLKDGVKMGSPMFGCAILVWRRVVRRGEQHYSTRLTTADVLRIRSSAATGIALAAEYGVSTRTISAIRRRHNWKHVC